MLARRRFGALAPHLNTNGLSSQDLVKREKFAWRSCSSAGISGSGTAVTRGCQPSHRSGPRRYAIRSSRCGGIVIESGIVLVRLSIIMTKFQCRVRGAGGSPGYVPTENCHQLRQGLAPPARRPRACRAIQTSARGGHGRRPLKCGVAGSFFLGLGLPTQWTGSVGIC